MTQRERLAAALAEANFVSDNGNDGFDYGWIVGPYESREQAADALLARGVRVVDVDTMTRAVLRDDHGSHPCTYDECHTGHKAYAMDLLRALDAEADR